MIKLWQRTTPLCSVSLLYIIISPFHIDTQWSDHDELPHSIVKGIFAMQLNIYMCQISLSLYYSASPSDVTEVSSVILTEFHASVVFFIKMFVFCFFLK